MFDRKLEVIGLFDKIKVLISFEGEKDLDRYWGIYIKKILGLIKYRDIRIIAYDIKMLLQYMVETVSYKDTTKFKILTQELIFIYDSIVTPIKFDTSLININGAIRGQIQIGNYQYAAVDVIDIQSNLLDIQYNSKSEALVNKNIERLKKLDNQCIFNMLLRIQDISEIESSYWKNVTVITKFLAFGKANVIQNWEQYDINTLNNDLNQIPRHWSLEITNYKFKVYSAFESEIGEFWKLILEFSKLLFRSKNNKIQINGTVEKLNVNDIDKNQFKIVIEGHEEVVSYRLFHILLNSY